MADKIQIEGVPVHIEWHLLTPGSSFFIPALNTDQLIKDVCRVARKKRILLEHRVCIQNGMYGVRFWRSN